MSDLLFAFTEWLRTTQLVEISLWISNSWLCTWLQSHFFAIPILQTIHLLAIATLFASTLMINFKVLGLTGETRTVNQVIDRYRGWMWGAVIVAVLTGILLVCSEPVRNMINPGFWLKMAGLLIVTLLSAWFHSAVRARTSHGEMTLDGAAGLRLTAVLIILLWCGVITGGRWIAYLQF